MLCHDTAIGHIHAQCGLKLNKKIATYQFEISSANKCFQYLENSITVTSLQQQKTIVILMPNLSDIYANHKLILQIMVDIINAKLIQRQ